jgi:hypothetical protein
MDLRVMGRRDVGQKPFSPQSAQTRKSTVFSMPCAGFPLLLCAFHEIAVQFSATFHSNSQLFPVPIRQIAPLEKLSPPISATIGANICAKSQPLRRTFAACCGTIRANIPVAAATSGSLRMTSRFLALRMTAFVGVGAEFGSFGLKAAS